MNDNALRRKTWGRSFLGTYFATVTALMNLEDVPRLLTSKEAAELLRISEKHLRALVDDGAIRYIAIGSGKARVRRRFAPSDLANFIEKRRRVAAPKLPPPEARRRRRTAGGIATGDTGTLCFQKFRDELRLKKARERDQRQ